MCLKGKCYEDWTALNQLSWDPMPGFCEDD
jgi:hypothetical protein